jgi:RNA polymerase sigma-70 factor (ECF subfamily)
VNFPETNPHLLVRLRNPEDERAWSEFAELYRPAIIRLAQRKGLQPADCEDLAQGVLVAVAGAIGRWEADNKRARFRTWLYTVANRQVIDALRRKACSAACGGTSIQMRLSEAEDRGEDSRLLRMELRRQAFHRAAAIAKEDFSAADWQAFWLMTIEGLSAAEVAQQVGKTVGAVYAAKGRVMRRLIERIRELEQQLSDSGLET